MILKTGILMVVIGILAYVSNPFLIRYYIKKYCYEKSQVVSWENTAHMWEVVAGTGCVPKWVSLLSFCGAAVGLIGIVYIVISLIK